MTAPWTNPPPPDRRGYKDFIGRPVLTIVGGTRWNVKTQHGDTDIVHVTLVSLAGPDAGHIYSDVHVYTARVAGRLKALEPGSVVLSRVIDAGKAPDLEDPDQWASNAANAWWNANPGLLDTLRQGTINDFRAFMAKNQGGGTNATVTDYGQGSPVPQFQPQQPQQQYAPQGNPPQSTPAFVPPATQPSAPPQGEQQWARPAEPPAPPAQQNDGPPPPPSQTFAPAPNPNYTTTASGSVPNGGGTYGSMATGAPAATPEQAGF